MQQFIQYGKTKLANSQIIGKIAQNTKPINQYINKNVPITYKGNYNPLKIQKSFNLYNLKGNNIPTNINIKPNNIPSNVNIKNNLNMYNNYFNKNNNKKNYYNNFLLLNNQQQINNPNLKFKINFNLIKNNYNQNKQKIVSYILKNIRKYRKYSKLLLNNFSEGIKNKIINIKFISLLMNIANVIKNSSILKKYIKKINTYIIKKIIFVKDIHKKLTNYLLDILQIVEKVEKYNNLSSILKKTNLILVYENDIRIYRKFWTFTISILTSFRIFNIYINLNIDKESKNRKLKIDELKDYNDNYIFLIEYKKIIDNNIDEKSKSLSLKNKSKSESAKNNSKSKSLKEINLKTNIYNNKIYELIEYIKTNLKSLTDIKVSQEKITNLIAYINNDLIFNIKLLNNKILLLKEYIKSNFNNITDINIYNKKVSELIKFINNNYIINNDLLKDKITELVNFINTSYIKTKNKMLLLEKREEKLKENENEIKSMIKEIDNTKHLDYKISDKLKNIENKEVSQNELIELNDNIILLEGLNTIYK